jgi:hypothetical protein
MNTKPSRKEASEALFALQNRNETHPWTLSTVYKRITWDGNKWMLVCPDYNYAY